MVSSPSYKADCNDVIGRGYSWLLVFSKEDFAGHAGGTLGRARGTITRSVQPCASQRCPAPEPSQLPRGFGECGGWRGTGLTPLWMACGGEKRKRCVPSPLTLRTPKRWRAIVGYRGGGYIRAGRGLIPGRAAQSLARSHERGHLRLPHDRLEPLLQLRYQLFVRGVDLGIG